MAEDESARALVALSTPVMCPAANWEAHFAEEIDSRHPRGAAGYVAGDVPDLDKESEDVRARCVRHAREQAIKIDRRLWSWERRMQGAPEPEEVLAIVLSQESFKRLENLKDTGEINHIAEHVRILSGEAAAHWIDNLAVRALLEGTEG